MYCYCFPDRATFLDLAEAEGMTRLDDNGDRQLITATHSYCWDEIGPISKGGEWDEEGNVIVPPTIHEGHHCNFQGDPPEAFDPYLIVVNSASRAFLGGSSQAPSTEILEEITAA